MAGKDSHSTSIVGRRIRELREDLGWSQEKVGVAIGIDESSSRARISRYELGVHEPPVPTTRLVANAMGVPLTSLYCEDDNGASLLLALHRLGTKERGIKVREFEYRSMALGIGECYTANLLVPSVETGVSSS